MSVSICNWEVEGTRVLASANTTRFRGVVSSRMAEESVNWGSLSPEPITLYNQQEHFLAPNSLKPTRSKPSSATSATVPTRPEKAIPPQRRRQLKALVLSLKSIAALRRSSMLPQTSRPRPLQS
ncbi:hypothetical protein B0T14DRAFT_83479 [Immersiella caudata]|uniref:Uncharacterized protein n=1 Tax=Immersiella caudata TaxID=314043 RepID=A0AA40CCY3_9PEZI|nr:hypothetical protein B0T14DRAFT_83479 [Immersiella caudata]